MDQPIQLLLAANDWTGLITVAIFVIVAIVQGIRQIAQSASQGQTPRPPVPPQRRPQEGGLQKEIDIFLQEVDPKGRRTSAGTAAATKGRAAGSARRPMPDPAARRAEAQGRRRKGAEAAPAAEQPARGRRASPGAELTERKGPGHENLGAEVRQSVAQHLDSHSLAQRVQQDIQNRVTQSVSEHLGLASSRLTPAAASAPPPAATPPGARQFRELLRQPGQVRQAIIVNEILSRPVGLRRSRG